MDSRGSVAQNWIIQSATSLGSTGLRKMLSGRNCAISANPDPVADTCGGDDRESPLQQVLGHRLPEQAVVFDDQHEGKDGGGVGQVITVYGGTPGGC